MENIDKVILEQLEQPSISDQERLDLDIETVSNQAKLFGVEFVRFDLGMHRPSYEQETKNAIRNKLNSEGQDGLGAEIKLIRVSSSVWEDLYKATVISGDKPVLQ